MSGPTHRELLVLRHGKSSWDTDAPTDFERPLAKRGAKDAPRMGAWLDAEGARPDLVVSSPATRAHQTARGALHGMGLEPDDDLLTFDERIYGATTGELLRVLEDVPADAERVLIVGHNPGFEDLVEYLAPSPPPLSASGKLMPTCALARFRLPRSWEGLAPASGELLALVRPKELSD